MLVMAAKPQTGSIARGAHDPPSMKSDFRISAPPPKPLLIWDGECTFCRLWIERWRAITTGEIDYATFQDIPERFPEIPREQFSRSMVFIQTDGRAFFAAEAVYKSLHS